MSNPSVQETDARPGPEYLSTSQVAEMLGLSKPTVRSLVAQGKLPRPVTGGRRSPRWSRAQLRAFLGG